MPEDTQCQQAEQVKTSIVEALLQDCREKYVEPVPEPNLPKLIERIDAMILKVHDLRVELEHIHEHVKQRQQDTA